MSKINYLNIFCYILFVYLNEGGIIMFKLFGKGKKVEGLEAMTPAEKFMAGITRPIIVETSDRVDFYGCKSDRIIGDRLYLESRIQPGHFGHGYSFSECRNIHGSEMVYVKFGTGEHVFIRVI